MRRYITISTCARGGVVFGKIRRALYDVEDKPPVLGCPMGLAGREVTPEQVRRVAEKTLRATREKVKLVVEWA